MSYNIINQEHIPSIYNATNNKFAIHDLFKVFENGSNTMPFIVSISSIVAIILICLFLSLINKKEIFGDKEDSAKNYTIQDMSDILEYLKSILDVYDNQQDIVPELSKQHTLDDLKKIFTGIQIVVIRTIIKMFDSKSVSEQMQDYINSFDTIEEQYIQNINSIKDKINNNLYTDPSIVCKEIALIERDKVWSQIRFFEESLKIMKNYEKIIQLSKDPEIIKKVKLNTIKTVIGNIENAIEKNEKAFNVNEHIIPILEKEEKNETLRLDTLKKIATMEKEIGEFLGKNDNESTFQESAMQEQEKERDLIIKTFCRTYVCNFLTYKKTKENIEHKYKNNQIEKDDSFSYSIKTIERISTLHYYYVDYVYKSDVNNKEEGTLIIDSNDLSIKIIDLTPLLFNELKDLLTEMHTNPQNIRFLNKNLVFLNNRRYQTLDKENVIVRNEFFDIISRTRTVVGYDIDNNIITIPYEGENYGSFYIKGKFCDTDLIELSFYVGDDEKRVCYNPNNREFIFDHETLSNRPQS